MRELDGRPYLLMARPVAKQLQFLLKVDHRSVMAFTGRLNLSTHGEKAFHI